MTKNSSHFLQTNQVLFPGPGVTKNTLSALSSTASVGGANIEAELKQSRMRARDLFIAVIALGAAFALLLVSLVFSCLRNRKAASVHPAYIPRGAFEKVGEEQGHTYDNPFNPAVGFKQGTHARVET
jgi:hypothetical protein